MLPHGPWSLKLGHSTSSLPGAIFGPLVVHVVQFKVVVFTSVHSFIAEMPCCCAPYCSSRTENGVRLFGFPTDGKRTQNGALYKPEVNSLHVVVFNSGLCVSPAADASSLWVEMFDVFHFP